LRSIFNIDSGEVKYIEKQKGDVKDTLANVSKTKKELGWMPMINIYKGLGFGA